MIRSYYLLTKPGIIRGNALTATAGFFFASRATIDSGLFIAMLVGLSLVIASACVFNNYIDRDIDKAMQRTKNRALVTGEISAFNALVFGSVLVVAGATILVLFTNTLTTALALFGLFAYVVLYGIGKRASSFGTLIGSISGSIPPVVGYAAVANTIDITAVLLFVIVVFWQMPHFYAIAIYRLKDYAAASIPVLPIARSIKRTKLSIVAYIVGFALSCIALAIISYASITFAIVMTIISLLWIIIAVKGFTTSDDTKWARGVFGFSLIVILMFSFTLAIDTLLP